MSDPEDASKDPKPPSESADVVLLHSPTEDGKGVRVLRAREGRVEAGEIRPVEAGRPLHGDIVKLKPREKTPQICDVEVTYAHPRPEGAPAVAPQRTHSGPAKVASPAYRSSWDRIFGDADSDPSKTRKDHLN